MSLSVKSYKSGVGYDSDSLITPNSRTILEKRYLDGESIDSMWDRVSDGNAKFRNLLSSLRFLPNSPTLFNAGRKNGCTLSACFVFEVDDEMGPLSSDSPNSIVNTRAKAIGVAKAGGGVGYYFGNLRPKGSPIKSIHRKACGPVTVLKDYHSISHLITQGGKRELAQMGVLNCEHPDIREFIHVKDSDPQGLGSFNISVGWSNEWVKEAHSQLDQHIYGATASGLWMEQCESAWKSGCPGMLFPDIINKYNPNPHLGLIKATNPCFTGDTKVWTIYGPMTFNELVGTEVPVLSQDEDGKLVFKMMRNIEKTRENERVYKVRVKAQNGRGVDGEIPYDYGEFTATRDHMVFLRDGTQKRVFDLEPGDRLSSVYRRVANSKGYLTLRSTSGDQEMEHKVVASYDHGERPTYPQFHVDHIDEDKTNNLPDNLRVMDAKTHNALKMLGDRNPVKRFPEKNVFAQPGFREKYGDGGGFSGRTHSEESRKKTSASCKKRFEETGNNHEVISVEYVGKEDVYDGTVDDTHKFFIHTEDNGGVLVHNCGETPNRSDEPCNLGSLSLPRYFLPGNRSVDWNLLEEDVWIATEFLDNILDRNVFPHPNITEAALLTRKLGLGVMGWADLLGMCHIPYDSEEALALGEKVMTLIEDVSHACSEKMAKDKGPYKGYCPTRTQAPMRRNETNTSIAPTGTIALIAGVWGSIEPHFALGDRFNEGMERTTGEGIKMSDGVQDWVYEKLDGFRPKVASEIDPTWHVRHQAAFQKHTDLGVSKTVNLRNSATVKDVSDTYKLMYDLECKGGTIFRDGCRSEQVLVKQDTKSVFLVKEFTKEEQEVINREVTLKNNTEVIRKHRLPTDTDGPRHKFHMGGTEGYVHMGLYEDGTLGEIFLRVSKIGSTLTGLLDAWAISFSVALQHGTPLGDLCKHHEGTRFEPNGRTGNPEIPMCTSIPDYVCRYLRRRFLGGIGSSPVSHSAGDSLVIPPTSTLTITALEKEMYGMKDKGDSSGSGMFCPDCGNEVVYSAGCLTCVKEGCGWTRCG